MRYLVYILCTALLGIVSCDKIANPALHNNGNGTVPIGPPDHSAKTTDSNIHKVLLEDYSGHFCGNCPVYATTADSLLHASNGNQIAMIKVNVGYFADTAGEKLGPAVAPSDAPGAFETDFRTTAGTTWDNQFGISNIGLPGGMVDRLYYTTAGSGSCAISNTTWSAKIDSILATPQLATINIADSFWISKQTVAAAITTTFLPAAPSASYFLQVVLVEDSITDWQRDYNRNPNDNATYLHHFVMRTDMNGNWGASIPFSTSSHTSYYVYNSTKFFYQNTPNTISPKKWNMAHMWIVAFIYQANTYKVVQAQRLHL